MVSEVVKTLAYSDAESCLSLAKPKALEAGAGPFHSWILQGSRQPKSLSEAKVTTELFPYQKEAVERLLQSRHKGSMLVEEQSPPSRKQ